MNTQSEIAADSLASLVTPDTQKLAARMAQDAFAQIFRLTLTGDADKVTETLSTLEPQSFNWCQAAPTEDGRALRMALLTSGMDQWGLAYTQTFGLVALPGLSALLGGLRNRLDADADTRLQRYFDQISTVETDAIDFKIDLRRSIHLALWHAMIACEEEAEAQSVAKSLGGMMLALVDSMPLLGWRLLADALTNIQIRLLSDSATVSALAQESTEQLFASLRLALKPETYQAVRMLTDQTLMAWQQAKRNVH